ALTMSEAVGDGYSQAFALTNLALLALERGEWDAAVGQFRRALALWGDLQDVQNVAMGIEGLAWAASAQGRTERAAHLLGAAEGLRDLVGAAVLAYWRAEHE